MQKSETCNCCEGISLETPLRIQNQPGLSAISYRVGDYGRFRETLLARLSKLSAPQASALRQLTTRSNDDFSIALLDAWAVVSDVLTFYQERIANEAYLGTATEQVSIIELARLIGYELSPGVAASTLLAFTIDEASLAQAQGIMNGVARGREENPTVIIEEGTRIQSIPGQDEKPQNFETVEEIEAHAAWNAMKPRQGFYPDIARSEVIAVKGTANDLKVGDLLLHIKAGNKTLKKITKVSLDEDAKITILRLDSGTTPLYKAQSAAFSSTKIFLRASTIDPTWVNQFMAYSWGGNTLNAQLKTNKFSKDAVINSISAKLLNPPAEDSLYVFRKRAAVFGYNAPKEVTYTGRIPDPPAKWDELDLESDEENNIIYLESAYDQIIKNSFIYIQQENVLNHAKVYQIQDIDTRPRTAYGVSAKSTVITTQGNWWNKTGKKLSALRSIIVHAQSEALVLAELPIESPIAGTSVELSRLYPGLEKNRPVIVSGERSDLPGVFATEVKKVKTITIVEGRTVLTFETELENSYTRNSFTINANLAKATHGETVREVLGSGDATQVFQKFVLKQPPLTYVSAATPSGGLSTLEIRVNDLLWTEVPTLYGRGPTERIYITRQDDQGKTTVIFGDGKNGARLPSGQNNVRATYRKGTRAQGLLKANQLTQLASRPLGLKAVTNPLPPAGAQDGEQLAEARNNATLTIFTLGRVVSLKDYEDFAKAFGGIAKALATWTWSGQRQEVFLTVAGVDGAVVDGELYDNLLAALQMAGIPGVPMQLVSFEALFFQLVAKVRLLPDYLKEKVGLDIEARLREHFAFSARTFGQPVTSSEVISVIQNTPGVQWLDLDSLFTGEEPMKVERLAASFPRPGETAPAPAQLLTLDASPLQLTFLI